MGELNTKDNSLKYSNYVLNKAKKYKPIWIEKKLCFEIKTRNKDNYELRRSRKTNRWICSCKYYNDGKTRLKCCSHELSILYHFSYLKYLEEIKNDK